jgi:branched-chain amino acid aminotransferase
MDGEFIKWDDANVHILTHTLHYGNGVFEGTRAYKTNNGLAIYRLEEHTKRLFESAKIVAIKPNVSYNEMIEAQVSILRKNNMSENTYIRPLVYLGYGIMGIDFRKAPVRTAIAVWHWGSYLGDDGLKNGIRVRISSFTKNSIKSTFGKAKIVGNYVNSQMAKCEALESGYEECLMLDNEGFIAEGSAECFFMVKDKIVITPPNENSLGSITQKTIIEICKDLNIPLERRRITRDEVYVADESFFTGTAAEVTPIREIDNRTIGNGGIGDITKIIQDKYFDIVYGRDEKYKKHLTYI